mmetsp:Transcript_7882/g.23179  ORF Transcript_7882/g.23179 Transcript_7882/m.23179 type:complete len:326 (-) Transcript_7882:578-1555(-)
MARKEGHVSFPAGIVLGVVWQNHVDLLEECGYHGVLRKCFAVREVIRKSFRDQQFQGGLVHGVSGASRVKNVVHIPHVSKPASQQKWCLFGFVPFRQIDTSICCCLDFFAFQVVSKILNEEEQIVSPYVKPIVFFIVVIVNITPHRSHLLPNIVIFFGTFVGNIDCSDGRIGLGGTNHESVTFGSPGFSNGANVCVMVFLHGVHHAQDFGCPFHLFGGIIDAPAKHIHSANRYGIQGHNVLVGSAARDPNLLAQFLVRLGHQGRRPGISVLVFSGFEHPPEDRHVGNPFDGLGFFVVVFRISVGIRCESRTGRGLPKVVYGIPAF